MKTLVSCFILLGLIPLGVALEAPDNTENVSIKPVVRKPGIYFGERVNLFPEFKYYPFKPVPGYSGFKKPFLKMPPEYIPYPGSLEHYRHFMMKYIPAIPFYNHKSLIINWIMKDFYKDQPSKLSTFAEKVYRYNFPCDRGSLTRGELKEKRAAVKVLKLKPGDRFKPFTFGPLEPGMYVLRVIGAIKPEDKTYPVKEMFFELLINDKKDNGNSRYVLRGRAMDNFYQTVDFYFNVPTKRTITAELTYSKLSQPDLYVYNVDLHNALAEMQFKGIKKRQTLPFNPKLNIFLSRVIQKEKSQNNAFSKKSVEAIWKQVPPINSMVAYNAIVWAPSSSKEDKRKYHKKNKVILYSKMWKIASSAEGFHLTRSKTDAKLSSVNMKPTISLNEEIDLTQEDDKNEDFTDELSDEVTTGKTLVTDFYYSDILKGKSLPGTRDFGCGQLIKTKHGMKYSADLPLATKTAYTESVPSVTTIEQIASKNNSKKLFEKTFRFAAFVYQLPSLTFNHHLPHQVNIWDPDRMPGHLGYNVLGQGNPDAWLPSYEALFPYISKSQKLADALHMFIPSIKTPDDVVRLFDTNLLHYTAKLYRYYRIYWGAGGFENLMKISTMQNNLDASKLTMDWLKKASYRYPNALGGFMDHFSIGTTRDGGTTIGSFFYGQGNTLHFHKMLQSYYESSGNKAFDVSNYKKFPKLHAGIRFPIDARVAGYYPPGIGDVGGPAIPYYQWQNYVPDSALTLYRLTGKPEYAKLLVKYQKSSTFSKLEWAEIEKKAKKARDPLLTKKSRVQADWQAILESGSEYDDPRAKAAVSICLTKGSGHGHNDIMDMRIWAHGLTMSGDAGQRPSYGKPVHSASKVHNLALIDNEGAPAHAWVKNLADLQNVQYVDLEGISGKRYQRQVMLIKLSEGTIPPGSATKKNDRNVITPEYYILDVFRLEGGKTHTYCFHGCVDDDFKVNISHRKNPEGVYKEFLKDYFYDKKYYKLFAQAFGDPPEIKIETDDLLAENDDDDDLLEDVIKEVESKPQKKGTVELFRPWMGKTDGQNLEATWKMVKSLPQKMLKGAAFATSTDKATKLTLFNQKQSTIMHGICINDPFRNKPNPVVPYYAVRKLYAQRKTDGNTPLSTTFVALIEPYDDKSEIASKKLLSIKGNSNDANQAVALQVKSITGSENICFMDGKNGKTRELENGMEINAEAAFIAYEKGELSQLSINGGSMLKSDTFELIPAKTEYIAKIVSINYPNLSFKINKTWPEAILDGQYLEIGNDDYSTGYDIDKLTTSGKTTTINCRKTFEAFRVRVSMVNDDIIRTSIAGRSPSPSGKGLFASNEDYTKFWKAEALQGGDRWIGFGFKLIPIQNSVMKSGPLKKDDFPPESGVIIHHTGPGNQVKLNAFVSLQRKAEGLYKVNANVDFILKLKDMKSAYLSISQKNWQKLLIKNDKLPAIKISPAKLKHKTFWLKLKSRTSPQAMRYEKELNHCDASIGVLNPLVGIN